MKIEFTKEEYRKLIKAVEIAKWIGENGTDYGAEGEEFEAFCEDMNDISDHVKNFADDADSLDLVTPDTDENNMLMERLENIIDKFEDVTFQELLVIKLVERDCIKKYGDAYFEMDLMERLKKHVEFSKKYEDEIYKNGVKNIGLL